MKVSELKSGFKKGLKDVYPSEEIQSFFNLLSEKYLSLSRIVIALNPDLEVSTEQWERFREALDRLKQHEPIQYILGETEFYGMPFKVNRNTLIPRPETEELVEWILSECKEEKTQKKELSILDIGTGSGCIAISLAKNLPQARVSALDISEAALGVAKNNVELNGVDVHFFQTDILKTKELPAYGNKMDPKFDIVVSNPPYVRELEKMQMQPNVLKYEPETALFVTDGDPLLFYRTISHLAKGILKPKGRLFFEINEQFGGELKDLLTEEGFHQIEVKQDIYGKNRMLGCRI